MTGSLKAQGQSAIEVKSAPIKAIVTTLNVGVELIGNDRWSVEVIVDYGHRARLLDLFDQVYGLRLFGKYYLDPGLGADKFYIGPYGKWRHTEDWLDYNGEDQTKLALGVLVGYKYIINERFIIDGSFGIGKTIVSEITTSNSDSTDALSSSIDGTKRIDAVTQLSVGYRFGIFN
jgi:hypothetical protein